MLTASSPLTLDQLAFAVRQRLGSQAASIQGDGSVRVRFLTEDSRSVIPDCLFVVRAGRREDGSRYAAAALDAGAVAILCQAGASESLPRLEVKDLSSAWGIVAQELASRPSEQLAVVGITGTNGKTTTSSLVEQALLADGVSVARLGTLGFFVDGAHVEDTLTTPQPDQLAECFRLAQAAGASTFIMEVSSHALDQGRASGVRFDVAAFTNLTQDHLDYHGDMSAYGAAKAKLFTGAPRSSVVNVGDSFGARLAEQAPNCLRIRARGDTPADLVALDVEATRAGLSLRLLHGQQEATLKSPLLGAHNVENLTVAAGILLQLGYDVERAALLLEQARGVPGRMERCDSALDDLTALVDYAHTPDAVTSAITATRGVCATELVCVFGCGGDRDRSKRPLMGAAVGRSADVIWVTSDNPRTEPAAQILDDIRPGLAGARGVVFEEPDRATAIRSAIIQARPGAVVLVLGKGHETYQLVGSEVLAFDDRVEVKQALRARREARS